MRGCNCAGEVISAGGGAGKEGAGHAGVMHADKRIGQRKSAINRRGDINRDIADDLLGHRLDMGLLGHKCVWAALLIAAC